MRTSSITGLSLGAFAALSLLASACTSDGEDPPGNPDGPPANPDGPPVTDGPPAKVCALATTIADTGDLAALKTNQCNVPQSGGARKWYRISATVPGTTADHLQVELWEGRGSVTGAIAIGTYTVTAADQDPATCGVCIRAIGDKGATGVQEFFAKSGTVVVAAVGGNGAQLSVTVTNASFVQINPATKAVVANGCASTLVRTKETGTVVTVVGGGGGGGGCPATIGD
jgi:hypothetical protein